MKTKNLFPMLLGSLFLVAVACGDDEDGGDNNKPPVVNTGGTKGGSGNKPGVGGEKTDGGGDNNGGAGNNSSDGGEPPVGNEGGSGGEPPIEVPCDLPERGENGCFNCPENRNLEQFLNRCTDGECIPFDNAERLPLLKADGSVPKLPN